MNTAIIRLMASLAMVALLTACDKADNDSVIVNDAPNDQFKTLVISAEQQAGQAVSNDADKVLFESLTSGICLFFQMEGVTHVVLESVDNCQIAGVGNLSTTDGNCWEWTSTQTDNGEYVIKGGSWDSSRDQCRSEYSGDTRNGSQGYANVGFRVVRIDK